MKWTQIIFSLSHSSVYDSDCHLKPHNNDMVTAKRKKNLVVSLISTHKISLQAQLVMENSYFF